MTNTDIYVILVLEVSVILFTFLVAYKDHDIRKREKEGGLSAEVTRGEQSMGSLYTVYGATLASFLVLVDNAVGVEGHKVILIVLNFLCTTYLYFFSTWFRNSVFFPFMKKVRKD